MQDKSESPRDEKERKKEGTDVRKNYPIQEYPNQII